MRAWRLVYWFITGALLGLGFSQWLGDSLGVLLLPIGLVLLIIGLFALRGRELVAGVAGVAGFGALPTLLFVYVIVSFPPPPDVAPFIYGGALVYGAISVAGLVALGLVSRPNRHGSGPATA
jgi:hypothetical protein